MDAPEEDQDIKLQRISSDLIEDFDRSLLPYLRKSDGSGGTTVRRRVRSRETGRLVSTVCMVHNPALGDFGSFELISELSFIFKLLDPFQELPQLLDPQLPKWLPVLAESFLEYLQTRRRSKPLSTRSDLLMPLSAGICRILYTFCKVRGEKVVVRFLNNETRYLDVLLSALEDSERKADPAAVEWTWEQRYVVLLWLSHLFLAPFDLATISSVDVDEEELPAIPGFLWPANLPAITVRILPLAIKYLASPGKERDAAKALLVRVAMRRDMQDLGVLDALVQWALASLRLQKDIASQTSYYHIGMLSFLAGILASSANTSDMDKYLFKIFEAAHAASSDSVGAITSSALARKTLIKVMRSITVLVLRNQQLDMAGTELVETTIGHLLERLADNDTPVRLAASKALSVITLKLDMEMASQVVEAVLESLSRNVLWTRNPTNPSAAPTRDLSAVDPLEWHGLMLTLSHLLYRRSPPAEKLSYIVQALLMGLSFEQRSSSGNTVGTNVRDASCFGIWAIARRYTTKELLAVTTKSISAARHHPAESSVLQILATELIVTASLDPAGNIRRGSSAALQELIGRHPDVAEKGIWVVQTVDYHAVALRARAIQQVALEATRLAAQYGEAMLAALLSWRGIGDVEPAARRVAAASFGVIAAELVVSSPDPVQQLSGTIEVVLQRLRLLQPRQVEERHGLLLAFAAVLDHLPALMNPAEGRKPPSGATMDGLIRQVMGSLEGILTDCKTKTHRRPELVAEAASRLVVSSFPLFQAAMLGPNGETESLPSVNILPGPVFVSSTTGTHRFSDIVSALDSVGESRRHRIRTLVPLISSNLSEWMKRSEHENIVATSQTGLVFLSVCEPDVREETIRRWAEAVRLVPTSRTGSVGGQFAALVTAYPTVSTLNLHQPEDSALICNAILERWAGDKDIDTRVSILQSLTQSAMLKQNAVEFLGLVEEGLDDYTTDARGDVGSHVRLQAIRATGSLWQTLHDEQQQPEDLQTLVSSSLFLRILRLAAEKLDRVRVEAQTTLALALGPE